MSAAVKTSKKVNIRAMEPEDISSVLEIDRRISGVRRAVTYKDLITGDIGGELDLSFVAEIGDQVIGLLLGRLAYTGEPLIAAGLIQTLGVDPDYQKQGIATGLVNAMLEHCRARGIDMVRTMVKENDSQLQGFFAHMGFRRGQLIDYTMSLRGQPK